MPTAPSTAAARDGSEADAVLDLAFAGSEAPGSGSGRLEPLFGNTLAGTPDHVGSVVFALTCTGGGQVHVDVELETAAAVASGDSPCDGSIFQRSITLAKPSRVGFSADLTGSTDGSFAFGYYTEISLG